MMQKVSINNALKHYKWGEACNGWNLVDENALTVKLENMPAGTAEALHYHQHAQQFFYILNGTAQFEVEQVLIDVTAGEGLHIKAGAKHKISNCTTENLQFLLCTTPSTTNDRINCT